MTVDQIFNLAILWLRRIASVALVAFIAIVLVKLLGFSLWPVQVGNYQELGVLIAGIAYALK